VLVTVGELATAMAERFDGGLADDGVVETDDVALRGIAP